MNSNSQSGIGLASAGRNGNQHEKHVVIEIGAPCSGKGEVAKLLSGRYGAHHYSSSAALRQYARNHDRSDIEEAMAAGDLVDLSATQLVLGWQIQDVLTNSKRRFCIFDGWGRRPIELNSALTALRREHVRLDVIFLEATDECLWQRAHGRGRNDDASIKKRIDCYREKQNDLLITASRLVHSNHVHVVRVDELTLEQLHDTIPSILQLQTAGVAAA
jgi:adenylate kinase family enzyme